MLKNLIPFCAFLGVLATVTTAEARPLDLESAKANAAKFCQPKTASRLKLAGAESAAELRHVYTKTTAAGEPAVYVFATGQKGFVLAAADDAALSILGYSDEADFNPADVPDGLGDMMNVYAEEIAALPERPIALASTDVPLDYEPIPNEKIEPMIVTKWGQLPPFNLQCPVTISASGNGGRCATGCMTTALAQILYYHRYPAKGYGSMSKKINQRAAVQEFFNHTYNWDAMLPHRDDYPTSGGRYSLDNPSVFAVSQLMFDIGVGTRQDFGFSSGSAAITIVPMLLSHFNYDRSVTRVRQTHCANIIEWNQMILDELRAKRPVYLEGLTPDSRTGGHAFVCDGYDGKGYFHINWGWNGDSNGYYSMTAMNPANQGTGSFDTGYSTKMTMVRNIRPRLTDGEPDPELLSRTFSIEEGSPYYFAGSFSVAGQLNIRADIGVLVLLPDGKKTLAMNSDNDGQPIEILHKNGYQTFRVNLRDEWRVAGTKAYVVYKSCGTQKWKYARTKTGGFCGLTILNVLEDGYVSTKATGDDPNEEIESTGPSEAIAQWNGDFPQAKNGWTLDVHGNTVEKGAVKQVNASVGQGITVNYKNYASGFDAATVIFNLADLPVPTGDQKLFLVSMRNSGSTLVNDPVGIWLDSSLYPKPIVGGEPGTSQPTVSQPLTAGLAERVLALTYEKDNALKLYELVNGVATLKYSAAPGKSVTVAGITFGVQRAGSTFTVAQGATLKALAIYDGVLSKTQLSGFSFEGE